MKVLKPDAYERENPYVLDQNGEPEWEFIPEHEIDLESNCPFDGIPQFTRYVPLKLERRKIAGKLRQEVLEKLKELLNSRHEHQRVEGYEYVWLLHRKHKVGWKELVPLVEKLVYEEPSAVMIVAQKPPTKLLNLAKARAGMLQGSKFVDSRGSFCMAGPDSYSAVDRCDRAGSLLRGYMAIAAKLEPQWGAKTIDSILKGKHEGDITTALEVLEMCPAVTVDENVVLGIAQKCIPNGATNERERMAKIVSDRNMKIKADVRKLVEKRLETHDYGIHNAGKKWDLKMLETLKK